MNIIEAIKSLITSNPEKIEVTRKDLIRALEHHKNGTYSTEEALNWLGFKK